MKNYSSKHFFFVFLFYYKESVYHFERGKISQFQKLGLKLFIIKTELILET